MTIFLFVYKNPMKLVISLHFHFMKKILFGSAPNTFGKMNFLLISEKTFLSAASAPHARAAKLIQRLQNNHVLGILLAINHDFLGRQSAVLGLGYDCYCIDSLCFCIDWGEFRFTIAN